MKNDNKNASNGCYKNLMAQVDAVYKNCHEGSYKTRIRYRESVERFCRFTRDNFHTQKFQPKTKHIIAYVEYMQREGKSPSTIKTDLAGIRFFNRHANNYYGRNNEIIDNSKLNLEQREIGRLYKRWMPSELEAFQVYSREKGDISMFHIITLGANFGLRLEEAVKVETSHIMGALDTLELYTRGKNGQVRYIKIRNEEQIKVLKDVLEYANSLGKKANDKIFCDNMTGSVLKTKRQVQSYLNNHNREFRDPNRVNILSKETSKRVSSALSFHGLRYMYAGSLYDSVLKETGNKEHTKRYVSEMLAHHRPEITDIYLK